VHLMVIGALVLRQGRVGLHRLPASAASGG
jgi:hypothetical protein